MTPHNSTIVTSQKRSVNGISHEEVEKFSCEKYDVWTKGVKQICILKSYTLRVTRVNITRGKRVQKLETAFFFTQLSFYFCRAISYNIIYRMNRILFSEHHSCFFGVHSEDNFRQVHQPCGANLEPNWLFLNHEFIKHALTYTLFHTLKPSVP